MQTHSALRVGSFSELLEELRDGRGGEGWDGVRIAWSQAPNHGIAFHAALIFNTGRGIRRLGRLAVKYGNGAVSITKSDFGSGTGDADIKTVNAHLVTLAEGHVLVGVPRVGRESYAAQATDRLLGMPDYQRPIVLRRLPDRISVLRVFLLHGPRN